MSNLVDQYYQVTSQAQAQRFERGQLCWAPGYYLPTGTPTLELVHSEPTDERRNQYAVLPNPPANVVFDHAPVHELNLAHDEELLVVKAKLRLFMIASPAPPALGPRIITASRAGLRLPSVLQFPRGRFP